MKTFEETEEILTKILGYEPKIVGKRFELFGANLRGANLRNANLRGANISGTKLDKKHFKEAIGLPIINDEVKK